MNAEDLKLRTKNFALRIIKLYKSLPKAKEAQVVGYQMLRSGTSVGANYRAACRARSKADFLSKIVIVEEESDETSFWIELLIDSGIMKKQLLENLLQESNELTAIFTASGRTTRSQLTNSKFEIRSPKSTLNSKSKIRNPK